MNDHIENFKLKCGFTNEEPQMNITKDPPKSNLHCSTCKKRCYASTYVQTKTKKKNTCDLCGGAIKKISKLSSRKSKQVKK